MKKPTPSNAAPTRNPTRSADARELNEDELARVTGGERGSGRRE